MSDFVVWMSPDPKPPDLSHRWTWSSNGRLGVRCSSCSVLGRARDSHREMVVLGQGLGQRGARSFCSGDKLAQFYLHHLSDDAGAQGLDQFLGPVAGAMISNDGRNALVWRDRFGRHPLQMIRLGTGWAVTTSPELVESLMTSLPHWSNIASFIHGDPDTSNSDVLTDLFRIRPAEYIRFHNDHPIKSAHWWSPEPRHLDSPVTEIGALLHSLGSLYGKHPHVLALSSGLDSSTLAATAAVGHPATEAVTFSDPDSSQDEAADAAQTAHHLGLRWRAFDISEHWPLSRLEDHRSPLAWGPAAHPDAAWKMPFHRWLRSRRGDLPVMYGNGADELLWFPSVLWLQSRWDARDLPALAGAFEHLSFGHWIRPALSTAIDQLGLRRLRSRIPKRAPSHPPWQRSRDWILAAPQRTPLVDEGSAEDQFLQLRVRRLQTWSWERIMRSLAAESRRARRPIWTPFLDAEFWELGLSLSPMNLVEGGRQKSILRRATDHLLIEACRQRPKVGGFDPLVERGLAERESRTIYTLISRQRMETWDGFDKETFIRAYEAYRSRSHEDDSSSYRGSWLIWRTLATELWLKRLEQVQQPHFYATGGTL